MNKFIKALLILLAGWSLATAEAVNAADSDELEVTIDVVDQDSDVNEEIVQEIEIPGEADIGHGERGDDGEFNEGSDADDAAEAGAEAAVQDAGAAADNESNGQGGLDGP